MGVAPSSSPLRNWFRGLDPELITFLFFRLVHSRRREGSTARAQHPSLWMLQCSYGCQNSGNPQDPWFSPRPHLYWHIPISQHLSNAMSGTPPPASCDSGARRHLKAQKYLWRNRNIRKRQPASSSIKQYQAVKQHQAA